MSKDMDPEFDPFAGVRGTQGSPIVESGQGIAAGGRDAFAGTEGSRASRIEDRDAFAVRAEASTGQDPFQGGAVRGAEAITDRDPFASQVQDRAGSERSGSARSDEDPFERSGAGEGDDDMEIGGSPNISRDGIATMLRSVDRAIGQEPHGLGGGRGRSAGFER